MLQVSVSENLLVKTTAASPFTANQKVSRKGNLRVYLLVCCESVENTKKEM